VSSYCTFNIFSFIFSAPQGSPIRSLLRDGGVELQLQEDHRRPDSRGSCSFCTHAKSERRLEDNRDSLQELKEAVLSKTQRKTPTVVHRTYAISRIRAFYSRKVKFLQQTLHDKLTQIIDQFPKMEVSHMRHSSYLDHLYSFV
jgi:hypothetical protein